MTKTKISEKREQQILELHGADETVHAISTTLEVSRSAVIRVLDEHDLEPNRPRARNSDEIYRDDVVAADREMLRRMFHAHPERYVGQTVPLWML